MNKPLISNIQRFSVDDGPGIRTTVFFKGCNLKCRWCHNPECISKESSLQINSSACRACRKCVQLCKNGVHSFENGKHIVKRELCTGCGVCEYSCPGTAITVIGKSYTPDELIKEVLKDRIYFETSNGGVTFSGGEPMLNPVYLEEVLKLAKNEGLHTAVDTAGNVPFEFFQRVLQYTDVFLYDIKIWDDEMHFNATGVHNDRILENVKKLTDAGADVIIRTPVIMEWNGKREEFEHISDFLAELPNKVKLVQLLPYHSYGAGKYETLGLENRITDHTPPAAEFMEEILNIYLEKKLPAKIS